MPCRALPGGRGRALPDGAGQLHQAVQPPAAADVEKHQTPRAVRPLKPRELPGALHPQADSALPQGRGHHAERPPGPVGHPQGPGLPGILARSLRQEEVVSKLGDEGAVRPPARLDEKARRQRFLRHFLDPKGAAGLGAHHLRRRENPQRRAFFVPRGQVDDGLHAGRRLAARRRGLSAPQRPGQDHREQAPDSRPAHRSHLRFPASSFIDIRASIRESPAVCWSCGDLIQWTLTGLHETTVKSGKEARAELPYYRRNLIVLWITTFLASASWTQVVPFLPLYLQELGVAENLAQWSGLVVSMQFAGGL